MNNHGQLITIDMVVMKDFTRSIFTDAELAIIYNRSLWSKGKTGDTCNNVRLIVKAHKKPNGNMCLCNNTTLRNSDKLYQFEVDDSCNACGSKISLDIARGLRIQEQLITLLEARTRRADIIPRQPQLPCAFCGVYFSDADVNTNVHIDTPVAPAVDAPVAPAVDAPVAPAVDAPVAPAVESAVASSASSSVNAGAFTSTNKMSRRNVWISLTCNHDFHFECWKAWRLNRSCMCPLCNIPFDFQFPTQ